MGTAYNKAEERRTSFGHAVDARDYHRYRPTYPADAVHHAVGSPANGKVLDVADVGAGTGLLSARLVDAGHRVMAVEPSAPMREVLAETGGVVAIDGTGEATTLADHSVDAITYGQSWHWVEPAVASAEATRILRPGGTLAMLWNITSPSDDHYRHVLALSGHPGTKSTTDSPPPLDGFQPGEVSAFPWHTAPLTADEVVGMAKTWSWMAIADDLEARENAIVEYVASQPGSAVTLEEHCHVFLYRLA